jgi:competence ComEA-like helix-hairpin-helix protein
MLYSRPQLRLLLLLAALFLAGLGIREWRAGFPAIADRLEHFDREEALVPLVTPASENRVAPPQPAVSTPPKLGRASSGRQGPEAAGPTPAAPPSDQRPLDLNRATADELARLPGVGAGLAQRIVDERERRGRFDSPDALRQVMGVGPKKLAAIRGFVTVGD